VIGEPDVRVGEKEEMKILILLVSFFIGIYSQPVDEYAKTIKNYYEYLGEKKFDSAYNLSHTIVHDMKHSQNSKNAPKKIPDDYNYWFSLVKNCNLDSVKIFNIIECKFDSNENNWVDLTDSGRKKCYVAEFLKKGDEDTTNILQNIGGYIWLRKGSDGKIKMLGVYGLMGGTGP